MRKILKVATPIAVLLGTFGAVAALSAAKEAPEQTEQTTRALSLHVTDVRSETVTLSVRTQGEVTPKTQINLVPQVSGRIVHVADSFAEGGAFSPNTTLLKIDDSDYKLAVTSAEARVAEAAVRLEQEMADARIKRKQWDEWVKDGEPTPLALNAPQVAEAQAKLRAAEADLETARLNLARTSIKLPFSGRVTQRNIGLGQFVNVGAQLGQVFATDVVEVRLPLTDSQLGELQLPIGFIADENNAPKVRFSATLGGRTFNWTGEVKRINASIDQQTRLVYAIAEVQDPYGAAADGNLPLAVGLFVTAEIDGFSPQSAMVLPRVALRKEDSVYVIKDDKLEIRTVNVLSTNEEHVIVSDGVSVGDQVVTSPVRSAYDGMAAQAIVRTASQTSTDR